MANDKEKVTEKVEDSAASLTTNKGQMTNAELELQADSLGSGEVKRISYFGLIGRRFLRQRSAMIGLGILLVLILIALFGKYLTPYNYVDPDFTAINQAPNAKHWFGTDGAGIDLYASVVHGLGRSLTIGITLSLDHKSRRQLCSV